MKILLIGLLEFLCVVLWVGGCLYVMMQYP